MTYPKVKYNNFRLNDTVVVNGRQTTVTRLCEWSDTLIEVGRGPNGACVDSTDTTTIQRLEVA